THESRITIATRVLSSAALAPFANTQWFAAANREYAIAVYDPLGNSETTLINDPPHPVIALAVSTNGRLLAEAAEDGTVATWELSQKRRLQSMNAGNAGVRVLAFSSDEKLLLAGDTAGGITLWNTADGALVSHR